MGESTADRVVDPDTVDQVMAWLRDNYDAIVTACLEKGLPKPPPT